MDGTSSIKPPAVGGFFNKDGTLRPKSEIAAESSAIEARQSAGNEQAQGASSEASDVVALSRDAFGKVSERTRIQVNEAATALNEAKSRLKETKQNLNQQEAVLTKLQDTTDPDKREALKAEFADLQKKQAELAAQSEAANKATVERGSFRVQVGNQQFGSFRPVDEPVVKPREVDLEDKKDIKAARKEIEAAKKEVNQALKSDRAELQELRDTASAAFGRITNIEKATSPTEAKEPLTPESATDLANSVRTAVLSQGSQSLSAFNPTAATQRILDSLR